MRKLLFLMVVLFSLNSIAQEKKALLIKVYDKETKQPIPYANICFEGINTKTKSNTTTSLQGEAENKVKEKSQIVISCVGYKTLIDTLNANESKIYFLQPDIFNIEQVVVTATRTEKTLKNVPILTELISKRQLETTGAVTVQDALEELPGVEFSPDRHGANIMMHGLGPKYVLFLVDGERIAGEVKGNIDLSRLNTANVERIEIVKGAASSLYGSNAIGGVVNIITQQVNHPLEINLHSRISKYNELSIGGALGLKRKWFSSKTGIIRKSTDGYDLDTNTIHHTVEKYKDITISQKFTFKPIERLKLTVGGSYYILERFDANRIYKYKHRKCYGITYDATAQYRFKKHTLIKASWYSDRYDTRDVMERLQDEERLTYQNLLDNARLLSSFKWGKHLFTLGSEFIHEKVFSTRITGETRRAENLVFFAQDELTISNRWNFTGGFRLDNHSEYGSHFCPKISGMYQILPFNFRATYGMGFKAPSLKELYMNWDHGGGGPYVYGNAELKPETSNYGSFSIEFIKTNFNWSVSLFRTDLKNMIDTRIEPDDPNTHLYGNVARAMTQGVELLTKVYMGLGVALSGGYCFVDTEDKETSRELFGRAKHSGLIKLEYINNRYGFNFNLRGKFTGEKLIDEEKDEDTGAIIQYKQSPYAIWRFTFNKKLFSYFNLIFGVDNLFNYTDKAYLITPGRRYYAGINIIYK